LAAKLFATLVLLGAIAILVTSILGYSVRETLWKAIFDQLTAARQIKACQIETYFRTIRAELRLLATFKMGGRCHARIPDRGRSARRRGRE
jgi:plasmid stabilization system protein ParE